MNAVGIVKSMLLEEYPEIKFSVSNGCGNEIIIGILGSPYDWAPVFEIYYAENDFISVPPKYRKRKGENVLNKKWVEYSKVKEEKKKYWKNNSLINVPPSIKFDIESFMNSVKKVFKGSIKFWPGSLVSNKKPKIFSESEIRNRIKSWGRRDASLVKSIVDGQKNKLSEKESDSLMFGKINVKSNDVGLRKLRYIY